MTKGLTTKSADCKQMHERIGIEIKIDRGYAHIIPYRRSYHEQLLRMQNPVN